MIAWLRGFTMKIPIMACLVCLMSDYAHAWGSTFKYNDWKVARVSMSWLPGRTVGEASYIFRATDQSFFSSYVGTDQSVGIGFVRRDGGQHTDVRIHADSGMDIEQVRLSAGIFVNRASDGQSELGVRCTLGYLPKFTNGRAFVGLYGEYSTGPSEASNCRRGGIGIHTKLHPTGSNLV